MNSFEFFVPTRIVFKEYAVRNRLVEQIRAFEVSAIILVTDRGVVSAGLLKEVVATLDQAGINRAQVTPSMQYGQRVPSSSGTRPVRAVHHD